MDRATLIARMAPVRVHAFVTRLIAMALLLMLTSKFSSKLQVRSFRTAPMAALVRSVVSGLAEALLRALRIH